jgi:putative transposase
MTNLGSAVTLQLRDRDKVVEPYRVLIVNEHHLRRVLTQYLRHYNAARPHRALGQLAPAQAHARLPQINLAEHRIRRKQVLGGLTHEY